jgi:hypothetical protein
MKISKPKIIKDVINNSYYIGRTKEIDGNIFPFSRESKYLSLEEVEKAMEFGFYFRDTEENIKLFEENRIDYILHEGFFVRIV